MDRRIVGYGVDEAGDRYAVLDCGHRQHVRHQPPFINRPWTETEEGRREMLGRTLNCLLCHLPPEHWFALPLGDALTAEVRLGEIERAARQAFSGAGAPASFAVFKGHAAQHSLHCEVTVYFSPAARELAERFGAQPSTRPGRANLDLLAGDASCWQY